MRTGELRHQKSTSTLPPDQASKYRIGYARHGRQHCRGLDLNVADLKLLREHYYHSKMTRALIFSDLHNDLRALERLMQIEADYYFAAGDLVSWGRGLGKMGEAMRERAERVYVLPGNHESAEDIAAFCSHFGFIDLHERSFVAGGVHWAGLGYSNPTPFDTPGEYSEDELARRLNKFADLKPLVMVCHAPPLNTPLDRIHEGLHAGSRAVREFIERVQPSHFFCGHIHEAEGQVVHMGETRAMNVGKKGYLLEV